MILKDRTRKRIRFILSVAVVGAVLATFSEVRHGICKAATAMFGATAIDTTDTIPIQNLKGAYARPLMTFNSQQLRVGIRRHTPNVNHEIARRLIRQLMVIRPQAAGGIAERGDAVLQVQGGG
jgi:hypothetical protein